MNRTNGEEINERLNVPKVHRLVKLDVFKGTQEENWLEHVNKQISTFYGGLSMVKDKIKEVSKIFEQLDKFEDIELRFDLKRDFRKPEVEEQKHLQVKLFRQLHDHIEEFKIIFERFGVFSSSKAAAYYQYYQELKKIYIFLEKKMSQSEMNINFWRLSDLSQVNDTIKELFKYENIITYMKKKAGIPTQKSSLKKRSPTKTKPSTQI